MARQCHLNTCPVGIATQRPDLRAKFAGSVDQVIRYLHLVAEETRAILSALGLRSLRDLVGRVDLIRPLPDVDRPGIDVGALLEQRIEAPPSRSTVVERSTGRLLTLDDEARGELTLNRRLLRRARRDLGRTALTLHATIRNTDRSVGAAIAGAIARQRGDAGLPGTPVRLLLTGDAGQSLGAFALPGIQIHLRGSANDGVGKGMHGGLITIAPSSPGLTPGVLVGNAALYGATGGCLFVAGCAGDRFAVRNSGATAVVEGAGHHACEYMTGGTVVVLGPVGANFAAGLTGGVAFVYDADRSLAARLNREHIVMSRVTPDHLPALFALVHEHRAHTGSLAARAVLNAWPRAARNFQVVVPQAVGGPLHVVEASPVVSDRRDRLRADSGGSVTDVRAVAGV